MKAFLVFAFAFVLGAAVTGRLQAAPAKPLIPAKQDCVINVASDKFSADLNAKTGTYSGNVIVTQCDTRMRADTVHIDTVNNQADKVLATGNVVVDSPNSGTATGQHGVYDVPKKTVTLTGDVVLKKGKDVMRGALLTVNLVTGQAVLGPGVKGTSGAPAGRVQGVFTPSTTPAAATPSATATQPGTAPAPQPGTSH